MNNHKMDKEPQITDYYNEMPSCYYTIEKLHKEYDELLLENNKLIEENNKLKKKLTNFHYIVGILRKSRRSIKTNWLFEDIQ